MNNEKIIKTLKLVEISFNKFIKIINPLNIGSFSVNETKIFTFTLDIMLDNQESFITFFYNPDLVTENDTLNMGSFVKEPLVLNKTQYSGLLIPDFSSFPLKIVQNEEKTSIILLYITVNNTNNKITFNEYNFIKKIENNTDIDIEPGISYLDMDSDSMLESYACIVFCNSSKIPLIYSRIPTENLFSQVIFNDANIQQIQKMNDYYFNKILIKKESGNTNIFLSTINNSLKRSKLNKNSGYSCIEFQDFYEKNDYFQILIPFFNSKNGKDFNLFYIPLLDTDFSIIFDINKNSKQTATNYDYQIRTLGGGLNCQFVFFAIIVQFQMSLVLNSQPKSYKTTLLKYTLNGGKDQFINSASLSFSRDEKNIITPIINNNTEPKIISILNSKDQYFFSSLLNDESEFLCIRLDGDTSEYISSGTNSTSKPKIPAFSNNVVYQNIQQVLTTAARIVVIGNALYSWLRPLYRWLNPNPNPNQNPNQNNQQLVDIAIRAYRQGLQEAGGPIEPVGQQTVNVIIDDTGAADGFQQIPDDTASLLTPDPNNVRVLTVNDDDKNDTYILPDSVDLFKKLINLLIQNYSTIQNVTGDIIITSFWINWVCFYYYLLRQNATVVPINPDENVRRLSDILNCTISDIPSFQDMINNPEQTVKLANSILNCKDPLIQKSIDYACFYISNIASSNSAINAMIKEYSTNYADNESLIYYDDYLLNPLYGVTVFKKTDGINSDSKFTNTGNGEILYNTTNNEIYFETNIESNNVSKNELGTIDLPINESIVSLENNYNYQGSTSNSIFFFTTLFPQNTVFTISTASDLGYLLRLFNLNDYKNKPFISNSDGFDPTGLFCPIYINIYNKDYYYMKSIDGDLYLNRIINPNDQNATLLFEEQKKTFWDFSEYEFLDPKISLNFESCIEEGGGSISIKGDTIKISNNCRNTCPLGSTVCIPVQKCDTQNINITIPYIKDGDLCSMKWFIKFYYAYDVTFQSINLDKTICNFDSQYMDTGEFDGKSPRMVNKLSDQSIFIMVINPNQSKEKNNIVVSLFAKNGPFKNNMLVSAPNPNAPSWYYSYTGIPRETWNIVFPDNNILNIASLGEVSYYPIRITTNSQSTGIEQGAAIGVLCGKNETPCMKNPDGLICVDWAMTVVKQYGTSNR